MEALDESHISRASQRPALIAYVPLMIFISEVFAGLGLFYLFSFWTIGALPIHMWFVIKTQQDFHWVSALKANFYHTKFFVSNKGLHGDGVITFTASAVRAKEMYEHA